MNGGDYPIDNVVLLVADPGADRVDLETQQGTSMELVIGTMLPKQTIKDELFVVLSADPAFGELNSLAQVQFVDTWGQSWIRGPFVLRQTENPARSC
jgi:hypothetical protein